MAVTEIDPRNDEAMRGIIELVYTELRNGCEVPKHMDAVNTIRQIRGVLETCEISGVEPSHVMKRMQDVGALTHNHRSVILNDYSTASYS